jgi:hypothetical protein
MLVAKRLHHAGDGAAHERDIIHGLVYKILVDESPCLPEWQEEGLKIFGRGRLLVCGAGGRGRGGGFLQTGQARKRYEVTRHKAARERAKRYHNNSQDKQNNF